MPEPVVVFVAGTATEVGKTYVAARLARALAAQGHAVAARKPVQSFDPGHGPTDAEVLAAATGEDPAEVCRPGLSFPLPYAPPMAADALGLPRLLLDDVLPSLPRRGLVLVEGVGGPRSPVTHDADNVDLCRAVGASAAVLVADAGLGTVNATLLSAGALAPVPLIVHLNRFDGADDLQRRNLAWLRARAALEVTTAIAQLAGALLARTGAAREMEVG